LVKISQVVGALLFEDMMKAAGEVKLSLHAEKMCGGMENVIGGSKNFYFQN
jgi:hypothetical protein